MPDNSPDVEVPRNPGMNLMARDLSPYYSGDAEDLVKEELIGPRHYRMGVVPSHLTRAAKAGAMSGIMSGAMEGTGAAASAAYDAGIGTLMAPVRPDKLVSQTKDVRRLLNRASSPEATQEQASEALSGAGQSFGKLVSQMGDFVSPYSKAYREYRYPASTDAEAAAKRLAKAKRKKNRREADSVSLYDRFVKPFKEDARISRRVKKQMNKGGPIQLTVPPSKQQN